MNLTSTAALNAAGATGSLAITNAAVNAGSASILVYAGAPNAAVAGVYLQFSPDFVGSFTLYRHPSGMEASPATGPENPASLQFLISGTDKALSNWGPGPLEILTGTDAVTLTLISCAGGSLTLNVVQ